MFAAPLLLQRLVAAVGRDAGRGGPYVLVGLWCCTYRGAKLQMLAGECALLALALLGCDLTKTTLNRLHYILIDRSVIRSQVPAAQDVALPASHNPMGHSCCAQAGVATALFGKVLRLTQSACLARGSGAILK